MGDEDCCVITLLCVLLPKCDFPVWFLGWFGWCDCVRSVGLCEVWNRCSFGVNIVGAWGLDLWFCLYYNGDAVRVS